MMRLKPAWEVCREVGFRARSLLFENTSVGWGGFSPDGVGGLTFLWGGFGWGGGFHPKGGCFLSPFGGVWGGIFSCGYSTKYSTRLGFFFLPFSGVVFSTRLGHRGVQLPCLS